MKRSDRELRQLAEKYFNNQCSREEAAQVLQWFDTPAGQDFLVDRMESDMDDLDEESLAIHQPDLNSRRLWSRIQSQLIRKEAGPPTNVRSRDFWTIGLRAAAAILVVMVASFFYQQTEVALSEAEEVLAELPDYETITSGDEQRNVTLGDGTTIRLNSHSEIRVPHDYHEGSRDVELIAGEIYVDVEHDPEHPFEVTMDHAVVNVLGTAFNLRRQSSGSGEVQLAVVEGSVSFSGREKGERMTGGLVTLEAGQFAYYSPDDRQVRVEEYSVDNYLYWMSGRLRFDDLTMNQVCFQLERIYELGCTFDDETIADRRITSDFSNDSKEKTLDVIAETLNLTYRVAGEKEVKWMKN